MKMMIALLTILALSSLACAYPTADSMSVSSASGDPGETYVPVLLNITNVTDGPIQVILLDITYNPDVIELARVRRGSDLPTDDGYVMWHVLLGTNKKRILMYTDYTDYALSNGTTGNIAKLYFNVTGTAEQTSPIGLSDIDISSTGLVHGTIPAINGTFTVTGDLAPYIVTYAISNTTITPNGDRVMDTTDIDLEFSEPVSAAILIENATCVVKTVYTGSDVTDPDPQVWDGTDDSGNTVTYGTYQVNITMDDGVNPTVHNNSRSIIVTNTSVAVISIGNAIGAAAIIPIKIEGGVNVGACDITLRYDPLIVNATNVTDGDFDDTVANLEHAHVGFVRTGAYQTDNSGLSGEIVFASVALEDVKSVGGTSSLNLFVTTFKDATPEGNVMPYVVRNGTYTAFLNGDVDGDGVVDIHDAMYLAKHVLGESGYETIVGDAADVNGDGAITTHDAMCLAKHVIGMSGYEELE